MHYEIKNPKDEGWHQLGEWFTSFIDLAERLYQAKKFGHTYKRVLVALPKSDLVSTALAIGFSKAAFKAGTDLAKSRELHDINVGDLIQIRSAWIEGGGMATVPSTVVGTVTDIDDSDRGRNLKLSFQNGKPAVQRLILNHLCPVGEKSPATHIRLYDVPRGTPQRLEQEDRGNDLVFRKVPLPVAIEAKLDWEKWEHQISPTLAVFGRTTKIEEAGKLLFRDPEVHGKLLNIDEDSVYNASRLDSLSNDKKAHFVNAIEQIVSFPKKNTSSAETLAHFPFVCLDGNSAIFSLSDEQALRDKCVIGLWETGSQANQETALTAFLETATMFKSVTNFEEKLEWKAPPGVQCWGWS
jgi:hypothetical protein